MNKKLSCRREAALRSMSFEILLSLNNTMCTFGEGKIANILRYFYNIVTY